VGPAISRSGRSPGTLLSEITNRVVAFMHGSALTSAIRNTGHADGDPDSIFDFRFGLSSGRSGSQITATARDRVGAGLTPAPPTPPDVRVRIRRFAQHSRKRR
jgi:hypothetical protein